MICEQQSFIIVYSILLTLSIRSGYALTRACGWGKLVVQGRACIGRPSDNFVLFVQLFTLHIIQFQFGRCSGAAIGFVFCLLQFSTKDHTIPQKKQPNAASPLRPAIFSAHRLAFQWRHTPTHKGNDIRSELVPTANYVICLRCIVIEARRRQHDN